MIKRARSALGQKHHPEAHHQASFPWVHSDQSGVLQVQRVGASVGPLSLPFVALPEPLGLMGGHGPWADPHERLLHARPFQDVW